MDKRPANPSIRTGNSSISNSQDNVYGAVIVAVHCHCESSPGLSDECSTQRQVGADDLWAGLLILQYCIAMLSIANTDFSIAKVLQYCLKIYIFVLVLPILFLVLANPITTNTNNFERNTEIKKVAWNSGAYSSMCRQTDG